MADPLLTSLCAICHLSTPKYTCPRCSIRTCSLSCVKKHKAWSSCPGTRDATAYVQRSRLRTAAGIDHDYNFLHSVERSMERGERIAVHDRGLLREEELRPLTVQEVRWRVGRDGKKRKVVLTRALREVRGRVFEKMLGQRLKRLGVTILCAPMGMKRQKENGTTFNRRSGRVNWQVEWLTFRDEGHGDERTSRALSKTMDDVPLHQAYRTVLEDQARAANRAKNLPRPDRGRHTPEMSGSRWNYKLDALQDPYTGAWISHQGPDMGMWPSEREKTHRNEHQFFLARPYSRADQPTVVTRLQSKDSLRSILSNTKVLEFPTVYVLGGGKTLPEGFVLGPKDLSNPAQQGTKRKGGAQDKKMSRAAKKRKQGGKDLEEGELGSGDDEEAGGVGDSDDDTKGAVGLEAGEVLDEQSFGEDEDGSEDDSTSSSGSDSD